jgi:transcriptional regulator NrdR family protein
MDLRGTSDRPRLLCPHCGHDVSRVVRHEVRCLSERIRRRRECLVCHCRWSTDELIDPESILLPTNTQTAICGGRRTT